MGILHKFQEGGIFMYFILVFGVFSVGLIVERYMTLYKKTTSSIQGFRAQVLAMISKGDYEGAARYAEAQKNFPVALVVKKACELRAQSAGDEEVQARMDEILGNEIAKIDQKTGFLAMLGNVATLLGLLGTISGMISSFAAVASANPADRATMLSLGISEAMNCTAFGLIVAIPALVAYAIYQNKTDKMVQEITAEVTAIFHDFVFHTETPMIASSAVTNRAKKSQEATIN